MTVKEPFGVVTHKFEVGPVMIIGCTGITDNEKERVMIPQELVTDTVSAPPLQFDANCTEQVGPADEITAAFPLTDQL